MRLALQIRNVLYTFASLIMQTIGRIDKVDFPQLGLLDVPIKIDTGAYTSTIHCHQIIEENGELRCTFMHLGVRTEYKFAAFKTKKVKSSNGTLQYRYEVKTNIRLFNKLYKIDINLSKRSKMKYPVLLGRKFLKKKFIVDVRLNNVSYKTKPKSNENCHTIKKS